MSIKYGSVNGFIYRREQPTDKERKTATKTCSRCNRELPLEDFHNSKDGKMGRKAICKRCTSEVRAEAKSSAASSNGVSR